MALPISTPKNSSVLRPLPLASKIVAPAKALSKFIKDTKKGEIVAAAMDGKLLSAAEAKALATIPSKEEIYAKMLGCINSPASGIVGSVNAVMASLTRAVAAVRDQKSA